jgi:quinol monooxygenase YgiN
MIVNAVIYTFPAERADEAARLLTELAHTSLTEAGCDRFDVSRSNDDPRVFVLYEHWADAAALSAHYETDHFKRLGVNGIRALAESRVGHQCTPIAP